jgi:hypothetical protein
MLMELPIFGKPKSDPALVARMKAWAAEAFALDENVTVMVTELRCTEPGCPPLETVIAVLSPNEPVRQYKIHKGLREIARDEVLALARSGA